ncbi:MAG: hypothetical protein ABIM40_12180 [Pseudomonadota bacterium]
MNKSVLRRGWVVWPMMALLGFFLILPASPVMAGPKEDVAEFREKTLAKLREEKANIEQQLSGLQGRPEELERSRQGLIDAYNQLTYMEQKLKAIQLWNGFVGFVNVANTALTKVNPITNVIVFLGTFAQDRAFESLPNPPFQARIKGLSDTLNTLTPSLRLLDHALHLTPQQVADELVSRGMVDNSWINRWSRTPEAVAESASVVTGKITFILERLGPARKDLYNLKTGVDGAIGELRTHIDNLEKRKATIDREINSIEHAIELDARMEELRKPVDPPPVEKVDSYPGTPQAYGSAFSMVHDAWGRLKDNALDSSAYSAYKNKSYYDCWAYFSQQMEPTSKAYSAASQYFWNDLWPILRGISDGATQRAVYNQALARLTAAQNAYNQKSSQEHDAMEQGFTQPMKQLRVEEGVEGEKSLRFDAKLTDWEGIAADVYYLVPWNNELVKREMTLRECGFSGEYLAWNVWGSSYYTGTIAGSVQTLPTGQLDWIIPQIEQHAKWVQDRAKLAQSYYSWALAADSRFLGYADMVDGFAEELERNVEVWNYLRPWGLTHWWNQRALLQALRGCSERYSLVAQGMRAQVENDLESIRESDRRAQQAASGIKGADKALEVGKKVVEARLRAWNAFRAQGIDTAGSAGKWFIENNMISEERLKELEALVVKLTDVEKIEAHVYTTMLSDPAYDPNWKPVPTLELFQARKNYYNGLAARESSVLSDYQSAWKDYSSSRKELEDMLSGIRAKVADVWPAILSQLYPEAVMTRASQMSNAWNNYWFISNWEPPDAGDIPMAYPPRQALFTRMEQAFTKYHALVDPVLADIRAGHKRQARLLNAIAAEVNGVGAVGLANLSAGALEGRLSPFRARADEIYKPLAANNRAPSNSAVAQAYNRAMYATRSVSDQWAMFQRKNAAMAELTDPMESAKRLMAGTEPSAGMREAEELQTALSKAMSPGSAAMNFQNFPEVKELITAAMAVASSLSEYRMRGMAARQQALTGKVAAFYQDFARTYESRSAGAVVGLLDTGWYAPDGSTLDDVEEMLDNSFSVFDRVEYHVDSLSVSNLGDGT